MRLREEVAGWVREVLKRVEGREGEQREEGGALRRLGRRRSKRETRAVWSEIRHGALRRSNSMEQLEEKVVLEIVNVTNYLSAIIIIDIKKHRKHYLPPICDHKRSLLVSCSVIVVVIQ